MAWAKNNTTTLTGNSSDIDVTITANKFNLILSEDLSVTDSSSLVQFNNNTNSVYTIRYNSPETAENFSNSRSSWWWGRGAVGGAVTHDFKIWYIISITGETKLGIGYSNATYSTDTAGNIPYRLKIVGKFYPSPDADITSINVNENGSGSFISGTNASVLQGEIAGESSLQDGTIFEETDTNKAYIWSSSSQTWTQL